MLGHNDPPLQPQHPVPTVVAHMMTPGVVQVPGDVSVSEAALLLEREHAPCLLVKETETVFGLMTPGDIVKKVVARGLEPHDIEVRSIVRCEAKTGVEMEAMTACAVAALTIYDMVKGLERGVRIESIELIEKLGGRSGHWRREEAQR